MTWASGLSDRVDSLEALTQACDAARSALDAPVDLAFLFVTTQHAAAYPALAAIARQLLSAPVLIGCSSVGVIGAGRELERREGISVLVARLTGTEVRAFHLEGMPQDDESWEHFTGIAPSDHDGTTFVLFAEPFSTPVEQVIEHFDRVYPRAHKIGGGISGGQAAGESALFYQGACPREGLVGISMRGGHVLQPIVAQGCRPIGEPMIITRCRDSVVYELNAGKPMDALQKTFRSLSPRDQELGRHSLHIGIEMRSGSHRYGQGDFLVREVAGIDPNTGAMAVSGRCEDYQVIQFHLRDAQTSSRDLEQRLVAATRAAAQPIQGALMFSCLGRGEALYGAANHDTNTFLRAVGPVPMAGFFAAGEIGPVGGRTFFHGYTNVVGMFSAAAP